MRSIKLIITTLLILFLFGCASPARVDKMVPTTDQVAANEPISKSLRESIIVTSVSGGEDTNPLWTSEIGNEEFKEALIQSLKNAGLYNAINSNSKYELIATLVEVQQPLFGLDLSVVTKAHYRLVDKKTRQSLLNEEIISSFTATVSDSFLAVERLRLANEGSAKANITQLIDKLYLLKI